MNKFILFCPQLALSLLINKYLDRMNIILRIYVWCKRIKNRCGFGIHSPSDFYLVTQVIYERLPFYAYASIHEKHKEVQALKGQQGNEKIERLLFRLVNFYQPRVIANFENEPNYCQYAMSCASRNARIFSSCSEKDIQSLEYRNFVSPDNVSLFPRESKANVLTSKIDFLYSECFDSFYSLFEEMYELLSDNAICVFYDIHASSERRESWKKILSDKRVRITFDLYEVGIVLLRKDRIKQNYIVNF